MSDAKKGTGSAKDELAELIKERYEQSGKPLSDSEAREATDNLVGYFSLLNKLAYRTIKLERRLKAEPDGFPVEGQYSCLVCDRSIDETTGWYHEGGQRCLPCHKAILRGVLPSFVVWARESYYLPWKLADFGLKGPTVRKMARTGELKARIILGENGKPYEYVFLKKENPVLVSCERYNPAWKSCKRNRDKVHAKLALVEKIKNRAQIGELG